MTFAPLILRGNLAIGADHASAVDVSDQVTGITIKGTVDVVEVPATLATPKGNRAGASTYAVDLAYLSDDSASTLFSMLWDALSDESGDKTLYFEGSFTDDAVSADNPLWTGNFIVAEASVGGDADGLSQANATYPLVTAPVKLTVAPS